MAEPAPEAMAGDPSASTPLPMHTSAGASEPSSMALEDPAPDIEEQPAKRQRLDVDEEEEEEEEEVEPVDDDDAVLALAADGITGAVDAYEPPE